MVESDIAFVGRNDVCVKALRALDAIENGVGIGIPTQPIERDKGWRHDLDIPGMTPLKRRVWIYPLVLRDFTTIDLNVKINRFNFS